MFILEVTAVLQSTYSCYRPEHISALTPSLTHLFLMLMFVRNHVQNQAHHVHLPQMHLNSKTQVAHP